MSKKFPEYNELDLSAVNKEMLEKWDTQDIFQKSLTTRKGHPEYVFYEDPECTKEAVSDTTKDRTLYLKRITE